MVTAPPPAKINGSGPTSLFLEISDGSHLLQQRRPMVESTGKCQTVWAPCSLPNLYGDAIETGNLGVLALQETPIDSAAER